MSCNRLRWVVVSFGALKIQGMENAKKDRKCKEWKLQVMKNAGNGNARLTRITQSYILLQQFYLECYSVFHSLDLCLCLIIGYVATHDFDYVLSHVYRSDRVLVHS